MSRCGSYSSPGADRLATDILTTLRVAGAGFAVACVVGVLLPFLLRRSLRVTEAVEPFREVGERSSPGGGHGFALQPIANAISGWPITVSP